ncbi:glycosyltransferase family 2 protein [Halobacterium zhouii]|uniref:glycosyltransferase family 2 protein n=1 Tax=Halobacterium zhouii TaxID=2902624 RepID=UPI001E4D3FCF|nr:glycosyltransferase family 2 protein [Halobacterium zhouii]
MFEGHTVAVAIPAYNEESFVADVIDAVPDYVDRVYPVDDGSTDDTWREIRRAADDVNREQTDRTAVIAHPDHRGDGGTQTGGFARRVVPLRHQKNRGVGAAIKTAYLRAREDDLDVTVVVGGDGQMDPEQMGGLIRPIVDGRVDYTKGNRFLYDGGVAEMPRHRVVGNVLLGHLTKFASGYWSLGDSQSGYTAISTRALDAARIEEMYEDYGYCNDLLVRLNVADCRVADVPRPVTYGDEESHIRYRTYVPKVSTLLLRGFTRRLWRNYFVRDLHPAGLGYVAGALGSLAGVALLAASAFSLLLGASGAFAQASVGGLAVLLGALLLVSAMTLDRQQNEHLAVVEDQ